ncbi:Protein D1 [Nymphon striatum]|nr:Protein D1 [Nymphon striatum]
MKYIINIYTFYSDAKEKEFLHWIVGNIPGYKVASGDVLTEFVPSIPPEGTGVHKILFLIYLQPRFLQFEGVPRLTAQDNNRRFDLNNFVQRLYLRLIAGNFYVTQFEDSSTNDTSTEFNTEVTTEALRSVGQQTNLQSPWVASGIVPNFIPFPPNSTTMTKLKSSIVVLVFYNSHLSKELKKQVQFGRLDITAGQSVLPAQVKDQPTVHCQNADPNSYYTLIMTDAKVPEYQHWTVGNIPGSNLDKGEILADFIPSTPSKGSGTHRILFLIYQQPGYLQFNGVRRLTTLDRIRRSRFSTIKFVNRFNLNLAAGNFYETQFGDSEKYDTSTSLSDSWSPQIDEASPWFTSKIVPDIIYHPPKYILLYRLISIIMGIIEPDEYFNGLPVLLGNELTPTQVRTLPSIHWNAEQYVYYTLIMMDVDVIGTNQTKIQFLHWMVGNIPGVNVDRGVTLAEFISSGPKKDSGLHRYASLVFRQPGYLGFEDFTRLGNTSPVGRNGTTVEQIAINVALKTTAPTQC